MKIIAFLGANAAGKTTTGNLLKEQNSKIVYICAGDLLRREILLETTFGLEYKSKLAAGEFAPVDVMNNLLLKEIKDTSHENVDYIILDGFPRTQEQLDFANEHLVIDKCIYFDITDFSVILNRSLLRGRVDDTEEIIKKRLDKFHEVTTPVVQYYRSIDKLVSVDACRDSSVVTEDVARIIKEI